MLRPHRHFKCCPLTFDCFWPGPKAPGIPTGGRWQHFVAHNAAKAELKKWNGKFNELAKVPSGTECLRSQLLFSSYIYIFFFLVWSCCNFFLQLGSFFRLVKTIFSKFVKLNCMYKRPPSHPLKEKPSSAA